jgi:hypothetical protein
MHRVAEAERVEPGPDPFLQVAAQLRAVRGSCDVEAIAMSDSSRARKTPESKSF